MLLATSTVHGDGLIDALVHRFSQSEIELVRAAGNAPFVPFAWVALTGYDQVQFTGSDSATTAVTFQQSSISQAAFLPIVLGRRDAIVIGEWVSGTHFDLRNAAAEDLDVLSVAVPVGWIRQAAPNWQLAAFVAPLGHRTHQDGWYWETLGGVFARHTRGDRVAWIFGAYFDVAPLEDFYTPYLGATFILNERWTINAVMPWPSVTYAPTTDTFFQLGVTPSGASWSIEAGERRPRVNLSAWNFGISAERRIYKNVWLGAEVGVSGLRGLSLVGSEWQSVETKLDNTGFALLTINLRVSAARGR